LPAAFSRLTPNFVPKMPLYMSSEVRALLEQSEDIFGTKFGVSLGKAAGNLFQKYPHLTQHI
jgi:hypothetical protein